MPRESRPPDQDNADTAMSPAEFEKALRTATGLTRRHGMGLATARIPDLRRALSGRVGKEAFDRGLLRLREAGTIALSAHAYPASLEASDASGTVQEGNAVLFFLHWLK
jgi:hypothetical protein